MTWMIHGLKGMGYMFRIVLRGAVMRKLNGLLSLLDLF